MITNHCNLQIAIACVFALIANRVLADAFSFDDIEFWVGSGANRAALVIDWVESSTEPPALAWGYRWDGSARGSQMLAAIVAADPRLFARLGGTPVNPNAVYGLGYDANDDGLFALDDGTLFDAAGIALTTSADDAVAATDPGDLYSEGWLAGFWHYGVADGNPFDGGTWVDSVQGMASRTLADGAWDSWAFESPISFTAYAENPLAAPTPFSPGDFNRDGSVDAGDYGLWRSMFGSMSQLAADGNGNGAVDAADYVIWRRNFRAGRASSPSRQLLNIPEPTTALLLNLALLQTCFMIRPKPLIHANER